MCQTKPGPRCASHLRPLIQRNLREQQYARELNDPERYQTAVEEARVLQKDYAGTRTGQKELQVRISRETDATKRDKLQKYMEASHQAYVNKKQALDDLKQTSTSTTERPVIDGKPRIDVHSAAFKQPAHMLTQEQADSQRERVQEEDTRLRRHLIAADPMQREDIVDRRLVLRARINDINSVHSPQAERLAISRRQAIQPYDFGSDAINPDDRLQTASSMSGEGVSDHISSLDNELYRLRTMLSQTTNKHDRLVIKDRQTQVQKRRDEFIEEYERRFPQADKAWHLR